MSGRNKIIFLASAFLASSIALPASSLFVGFNTATPVQVYSLTGSYQQDLGPAGGIAALSDSSGNYFAVIPTASSSTVAEYNSSMAQIGSFTLSNLITDTGSDAGNLLFSAYDGTVYRTTATGSILNSWNTGYTHVGVASDGTNIYTTRGDAGNLIDIWSSSGTNLGQIATPFTGLYGLAYDSATGDFWAGSTNYVYQLSASGNLIAGFDLVGDSRTPNGAVHDGLEIGDISVTPPPPPPPTVAPEPASLLLFGVGLLLALIYKLASLRRRIWAIGVTLASFACAGMASVNVTLTPSVPSGAMVGTPVTWTATATDTANSKATFLYRFNVAPAGGSYQVLKDWYGTNTFPWTPSSSEGVYNVQVNVRSSTGASGLANAAFTVSSRATGTAPVVTHISHPLVALYSIPPCPAGRTARVRFKLPSDSAWQTTSFKTCTGSKSLNFYVAGMRANSTYQLQHDVFNGPFNTPGPVLSFRTGALPSGVVQTPYRVVKAPSAPNNTAYPVLITSELRNSPYAIDSQGQVIWFLPQPSSSTTYFTHIQAGGYIYTILPDAAKREDSLLRVYDLAGNIVRETNYIAISAQLTARGDDAITTIHHEAIPLANGWLAFIGRSERVANQGKGPVDVMGDQVIVVDANFNVKWFWNEFEHLDITRAAILGETCSKSSPACAVITMPGYSQANDWTHTNAVFPTPDGNFIVSIRHQDWVVKVHYANGTGDGSVLWRLGKDGDFAVTGSSDPYPWFSHQHNAEIAANGLLTLFDNGNTRVHDLGSGNSRAQAWRLDESRHTATLVTNLNLGIYSMATGSTQLLSNGNYFVDLGYIPGASITQGSTQQKEYTPSNVLQAEVDYNHTSYRSFRLHSLYSGD